MPQVVYIVLAVLGFGFIVFIHELGHFLAAKLFRVKVKAFSLGFPPTVLHRQVGETDYRLGIIPVGGYVSMLGEDPAEAPPDDPRALGNIKPWKRSIIFLSGVFLNIVSAVVIYMIASVVGIKVTAPVVGGTADPSPARTAALKTGDRIQTIDGEEVDSFDDIRFLLALGGVNDPEHRFMLGVQGREKPVAVAAMRVEGNPLPIIGIAEPVLPVITDLQKGCPPEQAGLRKDDRITQVMGRPVRFMSECTEILDPLPGESFTLTVEREGQAKKITVDPQSLRVPDYGLEPVPQILEVVEGSAAEEAGIKEDDYLLRIGSREYPTHDEVQQAIQGSQGKAIPITVRRDGKTVELTAAPKMDELLGYYQLGIRHGIKSDEAPVLARFGQGGAAIRAGIPDGSRIVSVNDKEAKTWARLLRNDTLFGYKKVVVKIGYRPPGSEETLTVTVEPDMVPPETLFMGVEAGKVLTERLAAMNPLAAFGYGLKRIVRIVQLQYVSIKGMFAKTVDTAELSGPVRIGVGFYKMAEAGWGKFFSFLGIISVVIALLNAMPIPPLDGGHVMFLIVEKLIRRPVPVKVRGALTGIGTALLLTLVVLALYNDTVWVWHQFVF